MLTVAALYRFVDLPDADALRDPVEALCRDLGITGTLLLAREGINGTVAGEMDAVTQLLDALRSGPLFGGRLRDLDVKLSSYARLAARSSSSASASGAASPTADRSSWKSMEFEIQSLLGKLQDVNDAMSRCAASSATTTSVSQKLARHRDILHEFTQVPSLRSAARTLVSLNHWLIASSGGSFVRGSRSSGGRGGT